MFRQPADERLSPANIFGKTSASGLVEPNGIGLLDRAIKR